MFFNIFMDITIIHVVDDNIQNLCSNELMWQKDNKQKTDSARQKKMENWKGISWNYIRFDGKVFFVVMFLFWFIFVCVFFFFILWCVISLLIIVLSLSGKPTTEKTNTILYIVKWVINCYVSRCFADLFWNEFMCFDD